MPFENSTIRDALRCPCGFFANSTRLLQAHSCGVSRESHRNPSTSSFMKSHLEKKKEKRERIIRMSTRNLWDHEGPPPLPPSYHGWNYEESPKSNSNSSDESSTENVPSSQSEMFQFVDWSDDENSNSEETVELVLSGDLESLCVVPNFPDPVSLSSKDTLHLRHSCNGRAKGQTEKDSPALLVNCEPKPQSPCCSDDENDAIVGNAPKRSRHHSQTLTDELNSFNRLGYFRTREALEINFSSFFNSFAMRCEKDSIDGTTDGGSTTN